MISVCFQIFVPNVNRSQIDEMYNKTTIVKLQKLCSKVRTLMSSLMSISQAATKPVIEGIHLQEKSPASDIERVQIDAIKFERTQIHFFFTDVFTAVVVLLA